MKGDIPDELVRIAQNGGDVVVLTGAGISDESGVPTFRGPEEYWQVGSRVYQSQEMSTYEMLPANPSRCGNGICTGWRCVPGAIFSKALAGKSFPVWSAVSRPRPKLLGGKVCPPQILTVAVREDILIRL
jgi:hypothetical protein